MARMVRSFVAAAAAALSVMAAAAFPRPAVAEQMDLPSWLQAHVGDADGEISPPVLLRARALYAQRTGAGAVRNPCYFAMDATRPNTSGDGTPGRRFYVVCEPQRVFMAISAGHGSGRDLAGLASFANDRQCARNFGNAADSLLTAGGSYVTADTRESFKGYYRASDARDVPFKRWFVQFDGVGETANARARDIGGHAAVALKNICLKREPNSSHADQDGFVPFGALTDYVGGRSDGCTSWSPADVPKIASIVDHDPTTLYIYPSAADIEAVAHEAAGAGRRVSGRTYWNAFCLHQIKSPRFWSDGVLKPLLARYKLSHPAGPPRPIPICQEP